MEEGIKFFGEVDLKADGKPSGQYPAWFFDAQIEELKETIAKKERKLRAGVVHPSIVMRVKSKLAMEKERLKKIEESRPKLEGKLKDTVAKTYEKLAQQLTDSMPTRKEDKDGLVSPHEELKRLNTPYINIDPKIAKACGIGSKRKITGKEAARCYQILGKSLGENTHPEKLRRDRGIESYRTMDTQTAKILDRLVEGAKRG